MAYGFGDGFLQGFSQPLIQFLPLLGQRIADNRQQKAMLGLNSAYQSGDPGGIATGLSSYYGEKMGPVKALPGGTMPTAMERMNAIKPGMDPSLSGMFQNMSQTAINAQPLNFNDAITQANAITMQAKQAGLPVVYLPDGPTKMADGSIGFKTFKGYKLDSEKSAKALKDQLKEIRKLETKFAKDEYSAMEAEQEYTTAQGKASVEKSKAASSKTTSLDTEKFVDDLIQEGVNQGKDAIAIEEEILADLENPAVIRAAKNRYNQNINKNLIIKHLRLKIQALPS